MTFKIVYSTDNEREFREILVVIEKFKPRLSYEDSQETKSVTKGCSIPMHSDSSPDTFQDKSEVKDNSIKQLLDKDYSQKECGV